MMKRCSRSRLAVPFAGTATRNQKMFSDRPLIPDTRFTIARGSQKFWKSSHIREGNQRVEFICYPSYEDMLRDCGLRSKGTMSKAIKALETAGFIRTYNDDGTRRYLIRDVARAASRLNKKGTMSADELEEINDLRERFGHPLLTAHQKKVGPPQVPQKKATA